MKLYAWEGAFEDKIKLLRGPESVTLWKFALLRGLTSALSLSTPGATLLAMLVCRRFLQPNSEPLGLSATFTAVALVGTLQSPLSGISDGLASLAQVLVSVNRLHVFLLKKDKENYVEPVSNYNPSTSECAVPLAARISGTWIFGSPSLGASHTSRSWKETIYSLCFGQKSESNNPSAENKSGIESQSSPMHDNDHHGMKPSGSEDGMINTEGIALKEVSLNIPRGKLIVVCGSTGSGKSSLLKGLLGELEKDRHSSAKLYLNPMTSSSFPRIAYVPQDAVYVFNYTYIYYILS
jgi:ABC-type multidrug transport system fused ATPase/permease subunit